MNTMREKQLRLVSAAPLAMWCRVALLVLAAVVLRAPVAAQGDTDIYIATLTVQNGRVSVGDARNVTKRAGYDNQPHFTTDGSAILYTAIDSAGNADIWRYDIASDRSVRVTRTSPESEYSPTPLRSGGFSVVRVERDSTQRLWHFDDSGGGARVLLEQVRPVGYHAWVDDDVVALFVLGTPATLRLASARTGEATTIASDIGRSLQKIPGRRAISFVHRTVVNDTLRWLVRELDADTRTIRTIAHAPTETADGRVTSADFHAWTPSAALITSIGNRIVVWDGAAGSWYNAAVLDGLAVTRLAISPRGDRIAFVAQAAARIP